MKKIMSANLAGKILLGTFILVLMLHALMLLQVVPSNTVWGGQINVGTWVVFSYLILNVLADFVSGITVENLIFAPLILVMAFCAFRLAIEK
ncbi:MAG: hypothetical protein GY805_36640 [Chloroflexi bacterium]|nr:hypothetical protein [Chloroflexota bacterium]